MVGWAVQSPNRGSRVFVFSNAIRESLDTSSITSWIQPLSYVRCGEMTAYRDVLLPIGLLCEAIKQEESPCSNVNCAHNPMARPMNGKDPERRFPVFRPLRIAPEVIVACVVPHTDELVSGEYSNSTGEGRRV